MINILLKLILGFLNGVINFFLTPIFNLINNLYQNSGLTNLVTSASNFFDLIKGYIKFVLSYTGLYTSTIALICLLLIGIIMVPIIVSSYKLLVKWISILP